MGSSRTEIVVPDEFQAERISTSGDAGHAWLDRLPSLVDRLATHWRVDLEAEAPRFGANALVVLGRSTSGDRVALKVCWPEQPVAPEAQALRSWDGRGIVQLLEVSETDNALLLEGLDPDRSLEAVDLVEAAAVIGALIRQLDVPAPPGFPAPSAAEQALRSMPAQLAAVGPTVPEAWAILAIRLAEELAASDHRRLVHSDLHSGNVLAGTRQPWLAIDPRPWVGDPELAAPDLVLWRLPLDAPPHDVTTILDTMVAAGDLDPRKARAWTIVRAIGHWLWCLGEDAGLPPDADRCTVCGPRCSRILEALV